MKRIKTFDYRRAEAFPRAIEHRHGAGAVGQSDKTQLGQDGGRGLFANRAVAEECVEADPAVLSLQHPFQGSHRILLRQSLDPRQALGRAPPPLGRAQIDERTSSNGSAGRCVAEHEPVARRRSQRPLQHKLHEPGIARLYRRIAQQDDAARNLAGAIL